MTNVNAAPDPLQAEGGGGKKDPPPPQPPSSPALHGGSKVYKSGPLFLSSKGIGWTSWKKRWFILTQTSLVFYRSDPNVAPQKGGEVNLTLGGIDLNSSGSVVVKEDKKLITVSFTDGRDGRAFTLKAETLEDLHEWKTALEEALSHAPNTALVTGQNGVLKNDQSNAADVSPEQSKDNRQIVKSLVIGRPILLALEDIDGTPSFLEKALRFLEDPGVKTEGILRQAADVEDVECRIQEYEKGKSEFSPEEDPHVIADCVKYVLRELPSSPVPASCCKALLEAYRTERSMRVIAMRSAICETFPEPNRRLLQRILTMMQTVASHKAVNRMSISAVAACMAPLLLRPLLAGDCDLDNNVDVGGDGSAQLLQAAAAANHAQAIVITLLEEYDNVFGDGALTHEPYTDSEESGSESEEITDDDDSFDDDEDDEEGSDYDVEEDEHESSPTTSEIGESHCDKEVFGSHSSECDSPQIYDGHEANQTLLSSPPQISILQQDVAEGTDNFSSSDAENMQSNYSSELLGDDPAEKSFTQLSSELSDRTVHSARQRTVWGRAPGRKNLSMESIDVPFGDEAEIRKLERVKTDSQTRISNESMAKSLLQDSIERRKHNLHERRVDLEKDVARLQEQLQKEMDLKMLLEAGLKNSQLPLSVSSLTDEKMKAELEVIAHMEADVMNLKKKVDDLEFQLNQQRDQNYRVGQDKGRELHQNRDDQQKLKVKHMDGGVLPISSTSENFSTSKHESHLDKQDTDKHQKQEAPSSIDIPLPQNQQTDAAQNSKGIAVSTGTNKPGTTVSRKSSSKGEGTTSALSKLTNRLNFLKERRTQIANELQNLDKGRNMSQPVENLGLGTGSEPSQPVEKLDKHQESKGQSSDQIQKSENHKSQHNPNSQPPRTVDKGRKSGELQTSEGGKSESIPTVDKGHSKFSPRIFSR